MKNKKGVMFPLYLFVLTIVMILVVIFAYLEQQKNVDASVISPVEVMKIRDRLEIYELFEGKALETAYEKTKETGALFGTPTYINSFRENFFEEILKKENEKYTKEFILENLYLEGKEIQAETLQGEENYASFVRNKLYPATLTLFEGKDLIFERATIGKSKSLEPKKLTEISFKMDFSFEFDKTYTINEKGEIRED